MKSRIVKELKNRKVDIASRSARLVKQLELLKVLTSAKLVVLFSVAIYVCSLKYYAARDNA